MLPAQNLLHVHFFLSSKHLIKGRGGFYKNLIRFQHYSFQGESDFVFSHHGCFLQSSSSQFRKAGDTIPHPTFYTQPNIPPTPIHFTPPHLLLSSPTTNSSQPPVSSFNPTLPTIPHYVLILQNICSRSIRMH